MEYRLLVDIQAIEFLNSLPKKSRLRILDHFYRIRSFPENYSDYHEKDAAGRRVEISIFAGCASHYWIDFADRHIKVLVISPAGS